MHVHVIEPDPLVEALVRRHEVHEVAARDREELQVGLGPYGLPVRDARDGGDPTEPLAGVRNIGDLPQAAREYLAFLEDKARVPLWLVSVGARRDETIVLKDPFVARPSKAAD